MFYTHMFAFIGVRIAGKYSDKLAKNNPRIRLLMQGIGLLCAAPFIVLMGNSNVLLTIYIGFAGFGFARAFFDANTYAILYDVIPVKVSIFRFRNYADDRILCRITMLH